MTSRGSGSTRRWRAHGSLNPETASSVSPRTNEDQPDRPGLHPGPAARRSSPMSPTTTRRMRSGGRARPEPRRTPPAGSTGRARDRRPQARGRGRPWAHPNSRFTTTPRERPERRGRLRGPRRGADRRDHLRWRTSDREPLVRGSPTSPRGVYDGLTLGAEATFAAEGRRRPAALRPDVDAALHGVRRGRLRPALARHRRCRRDQPIFAHVNWFQRDAEDGHFAGRATARTCVPCSGCASSRTARSLPPDHGRRHPDRGRTRH